MAKKSRVRSKKHAFIVFLIISANAGDYEVFL